MLIVKAHRVPIEKVIIAIAINFLIAVLRNTGFIVGVCVVGLQTDAYNSIQNLIT